MALSPTFLFLEAFMSKMQSILLARRAPMIGHLSAYAYANTLTNLIPDLYAGLDVVSRELTGFIPSVRRDSTAERAAVGQNTRYHIAPAATVGDVAPAMAIPEPTDKTIGSDYITISKSRQTNFGFIGEEQRGLNSGPGYLSVQGDLFAQGLRALVNEMEADLALAAKLGASRAYGTSGTTPFASGVGDAAQLRKILDDNGAPASGRSVVISTATGANLRTNTQLTKANESGQTMTLTQGELVNLSGLSFKESAQAAFHTKGTAASATTNTAGYAVGATTITLASAGTGTIVAGDVISFAGDTNKYVVVSGDASVADGGTFTIALPGLRQAIPASATAITVSGSYTANIGFTQNAIVLATRAPELPQEGDLALDRMMLTDPRSGMTFEVSLYPGYRKIRAEIAAAWGWKVTKAEHVGLLLG
jgi:hypothetical protein